MTVSRGEEKNIKLAPKQAKSFGVSHALVSGYTVKNRRGIMKTGKVKTECDLELHSPRFKSELHHLLAV